MEIRFYIECSGEDSHEYYDETGKFNGTQSARKKRSAHTSPTVCKSVKEPYVAPPITETTKLKTTSATTTSTASYG